MRYFFVFWLFFFTSAVAFAHAEASDKKTFDDAKVKDGDAKPNDQAKEQNKGESGKETEKKEEKQLKEGNLAFPLSQQPTPLISFGQNFLNAKQAQVQIVADEFKGKHQYLVEWDPSIIYAFSDIATIFISAPEAIRARDEDKHSTGWEDVLIEFEYAPYTKEAYTYTEQFSLVAGVTIPSGSIKKDPRTGKGANSLFIGLTFAHLGIDWYYFTSYGGFINGSSHRTRIGDQFLYQYGIGRRIFSNDNWLFLWMLEFDGIYSSRDKIHGTTDDNSGGNIIYITPSLFLSSKENLIVQAGVGFPVVQQLNGHQHRQEYLLQTKISWTF